MYSKNPDEFFQANNISTDAWERSGLKWDLLDEIATDHHFQIGHLTASAEFFARVIQGFDLVHSVRWRVKSTDHVIAKIIRKRSEGSEKYADINKDNYFEIITDLVGIRALHLFKDDCFSIDSSIRNILQVKGEATAYIRKGDPKGNFEDAGMEVKEHDAGYRSIHYICATKPLNRIVYTEVQVRTIFEEGWSEIDHKVRYPNFSNNEHVNYFLTIFNRLAGSADEMGTFVRQLTELVTDSDRKITAANKEKDEAFAKMKALLGDLDNMKEKDEKAKAKIAQLQGQLEKVQKMPDNFAEMLGITPQSAHLVAARASQALIAARNLASQISSESQKIPQVTTVQSIVKSLEAGLPNNPEQHGNKPKK